VSQPAPKGRRVVISAGPTHEHLDPVRYLGNESSGKMGFELAAAAQRRGDRVLLIAGPVSLPTPKGVERVDVVSAKELMAACKLHFAGADVLIMAAAVADWRPKRRLSGKWKLKEGDAQSTSLELVRNPDILASLGRSKGSRLLIGFALETSQGLRRAEEKLRRKNADYIVLNDASALGAERNSVTILGRHGSRLDLSDRSKREIAEYLVQLGPPERPRPRARKA